MSIAYDGATINCKVNRALLGLIDKKKLSMVPWFRQLLLQELPIRFWPFHRVWFRSESGIEYDFAASNGAYHVLKRLSLQTCASVRKVRLGSFFLDTTAMLQFKLPHRVYGCGDMMSDKAGASRLSPPYLDRSPFLFGQHVASLLASLLASFTTASKAFTKTEHCLNAMSAYYVLAIHLAQNMDEYRGQWQQHSLSLPTARNTMALCAFGVHASMMEVEPCNVQEIHIEHFFAAIKAPFRGAPSVKDALLGEAKHHLSQIKELRNRTDETMLSDSYPSSEDRKPLSKEEVKRCAGQDRLPELLHKP